MDTNCPTCGHDERQCSGGGPCKAPQLPDADELRQRRKDKVKADALARHKQDLQRVNKEILEADKNNRTEVTTMYLVESVKNLLVANHYEVIQHQGEGPSNPGVAVKWQ